MGDTTRIFELFHNHALHARPQLYAGCIDWLEIRGLLGRSGCHLIALCALLFSLLWRGALLVAFCWQALAYSHATRAYAGVLNLFLLSGGSLAYAAMIVSVAAVLMWKQKLHPTPLLITGALIFETLYQLNLL